MGYKQLWGKWLSFVEQCLNDIKTKGCAIKPSNMGIVHGDILQGYRMPNDNFEGTVYTQ